MIEMVTGAAAALFSALGAFAVYHKKVVKEKDAEIRRLNEEVKRILREGNEFRERLLREIKDEP